MYACMAYDYDNRLLAVPEPFETEEEAWDCIQQTMKQKNHPKMMWVQKGVDYAGRIPHDNDSDH